MSDADWWPQGAEHPAFTVQRGPYMNPAGGDLVRGGPGLRTAVKNASRRAGWDAISGQNVLFSRPVWYDTVELTWGWPETVKNSWTEVAVVRSGFGRPQTPKEGVTIFRATRDEIKEDYLVDDNFAVDSFRAPTIFDGGLTPGHWYYYSVFFKVTRLEWIRGSTTQVLLPKDHHHDEHLWDRIPPWYHHVDDNQARQGFLNQFLKIFGFELDLTRQYIESQQETYQTDVSPLRLLLQLGTMFDVTYIRDLGDVRYRALVSEITDLYQKRGTLLALQRLAELMTGYPVQVTEGVNQILLPDSSDFYSGIGAWGNFHADSTGAPTPMADTVPFSKVSLFVNPVQPGPAQLGTLTRAMQFSAREPLMGMTASLGYGMQPIPDGKLGPTPDTAEWRFIDPPSFATGVRPGEVWGFSTYWRSILVNNPVLLSAGVAWADQEGFLLPQQSWQTTTTPKDSAWNSTAYHAVVPDDAAHIIPLVRITAGQPTDPPELFQLFISGCMVYKVADKV